MKYFPIFSSRGQGMVEYIILTTLIALSAIAIIMLFGKQEKKQFSAMTQSLSGKTAVIDDQIAQQAAHEETINPSMNKYGGESSTASTATGTDTEPLSSNSGDTPSDPTTPTPSSPVTPPAPTPPPPPVPTVLTSSTSQAQRHHVGDGSFSPGLGGGVGINEGITFSYSFTALKTNPVITQKVDLSFEASGINWSSNSIFLNGRQVGNVHDGTNTLVFWGNDLLENNTLEIRSAEDRSGAWMGYDDFEFWNFNVVRHDIQN